MADEDVSMETTLMQFNVNQEPIIAWAEGQRVALAARGWSAESADRYAAELLIGMTRFMFARVITAA